MAASLQIQNYTCSVFPDFDTVIVYTRSYYEYNMFYDTDPNKIRTIEGGKILGSAA